MRKNQNVAQIVAMLPHGSGIDCDWDYDQWLSNENVLAVTNSYHGMHEGFYVGYIDFTVQFDLQTGKILKIDVHREDWHDEFACFYDLEEYLWDTISCYMP